MLVLTTARRQAPTLHVSWRLSRLRRGWLVIRRERGDDGGARGGGIERAVVAPDDLAAGRDENRMRNRARPIGVERRHQRVLVRAGKEIMAGGAALFFHRRLFSIGKAGALFFEE